jgi:peptidyl-prolyl cis-trans isomerase C
MLILKPDDRIPNMNRTLIAAALCGIALTQSAIAQTASPPPMNSTSDMTIVATVDGQEITAGAVALFFQSLPPQYREMPLEQVFPQLVERLVDQKLIAAAAKKTGIADRPDVQARFRMLREGMLNQLYMDERLTAGITDEKLRDAYQKMVALEPKKEEVRARHILVKTKDEALAIIAQIGKGADFIALAKAKSTGPSGRNGGDLGFFAAGQMVPPFSEAAFGLKKGEVTRDPVKTQFGWHVIKVEDRRFSGSRRFEEVADALRQQMTEAIFEQEVQALRAKAKIDIKGAGGSKIQPIR